MADRPSLRVRELDVSGLPPPEPLERAIEALDALGAGEVLLLLHRREPCLLYPILVERGVHHATRSPRDGEVRVAMWRAADATADPRVEALAHAALDDAGPARG